MDDELLFTDYDYDSILQNYYFYDNNNFSNNNLDLNINISEKYSLGIKPNNSILKIESFNPKPGKKTWHEYSKFYDISESPEKDFGDALDTHLSSYLDIKKNIYNKDLNALNSSLSIGKKYIETDLGMDLVPEVEITSF
jgi:hypothetical protein